MCMEGGDIKYDRMMAIMTAVARLGEEGEELDVHAQLGDVHRLKPGEGGGDGE